MTKKCKVMIVIMLLVITKSHSQQTDSIKVLMSEISKTYKGDSKNGIANGKGIAKGEDNYTGEFKNGLPDGKGKYIYNNGNTFTGFFRNGLKNGKGVFNYSINGNSYTQKGYWVNGDYVGTTNPEEFFTVSNITGIENYSIKKIEENQDEITIAITTGGNKYVPNDFEIKTSTGQSQGQGKSLLIKNYTLPVNCEIHFTIKNGGTFKQCYFTFEILKKGKYDVLINAS